MRAQLVTEDLLGGLLDTYHAVKLQLDDLRERITAVCIANDVQQYEHNGVKLTFKTDVQYDPAKLAALGEFLSPQELEALKNKAPVRQFHKTKIGKLAKQGGEVGKVIQDATTVTGPWLKLTTPR